MISIGIKVLIGYVLVLSYRFALANLTTSNTNLTPKSTSPQIISKKLAFNETLKKFEKNLTNKTQKIAELKAQPKEISQTVHNSKTAKLKTIKATTSPPVKEFHLHALLEIGIRSNEANKFIRSRTILGKPLEEQYEITRESDMNFIETKHAKDDGESRDMMKSWKMNKV